MFSRDQASEVDQAGGNPYAPAQVGNARAIAGAEVRPEPERRFQVRMAWADRRNFLRAVGLLRFTALAGGLIVGWALYRFLSMTATFLNPMPVDEHKAFLVIHRLIEYSLTVCRGVLSLYISWLLWQLADVFARTAGGTSGEMGDWSRLQLRMARSGVALLALGLVHSGWVWLTEHFILNMLLSP